MQPTNQNIEQLTGHLFRQESGRMAAALTRILGIANLAVAEDIVQDTILLALKTWSFSQMPPQPASWLYKVAKNKALDYIRRQKTFEKISSEISYLLESEYTRAVTVEHFFFENEIRDSQLRMMFAGCHPTIPPESQIALTLKVLCGFGSDEIARAFLTQVETINKRIYRAKEKIREEKITLEVPAGKPLLARIDAVLKCLYLLFNEGYNSSSAESLLRRDLCYEAMRLCLLLTENPHTATPEAHALLSLMCFNVSRFDSRLDTQGNIIVLEDQNRSLWDKELIDRGEYYLDKASEMEGYTAYHVEAAIAATHCHSASFAQTDWPLIRTLYEELYRLNPSPMVRLNAAVVLGQLGQIPQAIAEVQSLNELENHYLYHAILGDLYKKQGNKALALQHFEISLERTTSNVEKELLRRKMERL